MAGGFFFLLPAIEQGAFGDPGFAGQQQAERLDTFGEAAN
jgi:hypothetical protein